MLLPLPLPPQTCSWSLTLTGAPRRYACRDMPGLAPRQRCPPFAAATAAPRSPCAPWGSSLASPEIPAPCLLPPGPCALPPAPCYLPTGCGDPDPGAARLHGQGAGGRAHRGPGCGGAHSSRAGGGGWGSGPPQPPPRTLAVPASHPGCPCIRAGLTAAPPLPALPPAPSCPCPNAPGLDPRPPRKQAQGCAGLHGVLCRAQLGRGCVAVWAGAPGQQGPSGHAPPPTRVPQAAWPRGRLPPRCAAGGGGACYAQGQPARRAAPAAAPRARRGCNPGGVAGRRVHSWGPWAAVPTALQRQLPAQRAAAPSPLLHPHPCPPCWPCPSQVALVDQPQFDFDLTLGQSSGVPMEPAIKSWIKQ